MKIRILFFLLFLGFSLSISTIQAKELKDWDISFKVNGLKTGDTCLVAYYQGAKQYIKDTLYATKGGTLRYKAGPDDKLDAGIFLMVLPGMKHFDFMLVEPRFKLETDLKDLVMNMKVKGSPENELLFAYKKYVESRQVKIADLQKDAEKNKAELQTISDEIIAYRDKFIADNPNAFIAKVFKASRDPEIPKDGPRDKDGNLDKTYQYQYYKQHYLDGIDFSDDRLMQTPVLQGRLKDYLNRVTVQVPDSIIQSVDEIIGRADGNPAMFRYCIATCMNLYAGTKKMCFDKIYVHIAGKYYVSGRATWVDSTQMSKIKDRYYKMLYNNCDEIAVNLKMPDVKGETRQLHEIDAEYTVVVFWAYDCGHCKKEMPKLGELYREYKKHGVEVFAVCTKDDKSKWEKFLEEKKISDWINVSDPGHNTNFRIFYDIYSTPVIYLLDKEKRIIGKRLDNENLRGLLNFKLGIEEEEEKKEDK